MPSRYFPPFRLERWFAEFEFVTGMRNLAASCPFPVTTRELLELEDAGATERYLRLGLDYIENSGSEGLRQALADLHTTLDAKDIQVTTGASEALLLLIWTLLEPGENIVVEDPCYENVAGVATSLGIEVRRLPLRMEEGWKPDAERLAQLVDAKTRLVYLNHPHNPTGSTLRKEEMLALAQVTERVGALLVNDEVFRLIALDGEPTPSIVDVVEQSVAIGDMTKPWGLGGIRVGWVASKNTGLLRRLNAARDYSTMCGSAPGEFLAELALRHSSEVITPRLAAARINRERLTRAIARSGGTLHWKRPEAGYIAFVQLPFAAEAFCRRLAQEQRILLLPGSMFGDAYERFVRICSGRSTEQFEECLSIITDELQRTHAGR